MGKIIVVGNEKGGCGKTTISVNIASIAARAGIDVLLVDSDPGQQSAAKWHARRTEAHPDLPAVRCVSLTGKGIRGDLADLAKRYTLVVVDTGAEDSPEIRAAAIAAQVLIVPVQPEPLDLWTLPTMAMVFERSREFNPALRCVVAVNRIPHQIGAGAAEQVSAWMAANVPGLPTDTVIPLIGRNAYGRASGEGLGVAELARRDLKAAAEIENLYQGAMA